MWKVYLACAAVATSCCVRGRGVERVERGAREVELRQVVNNSVCPLESAWDTDPARRPPRIRLLRCAAGAGEWCAARGLAARGCCGGGGALQCVELHDTVRVRYGARRRRYDVAVGCACMLAGAPPAARRPQAPLDATDAAD